MKVNHHYRRTVFFTFGTYGYRGVTVYTFNPLTPATFSNYQFLILSMVGKSQFSTILATYFDEIRK